MSDLIHRAELFNQLAPVQTLGEAFAVIQSMETEEELISLKVLDMWQCNETKNTNPEDFQGHEKFISFMNDKDINGFGRWEFANGYNLALVGLACLIDECREGMKSEYEAEQEHTMEEFMYGQELGNPEDGSL